MCNKEQLYPLGGVHPRRKAGIHLPLLGMNKKSSSALNEEQRSLVAEHGSLVAKHRVLEAEYIDATADHRQDIVASCANLCSVARTVQANFLQTLSLPGRFYVDAMPRLENRTYQCRHRPSC